MHRMIRKNQELHAGFTLMLKSDDRADLDFWNKWLQMLGLQTTNSEMKTLTQYELLKALWIQHLAYLGTHEATIMRQGRQTPWRLGRIPATYLS